MIREQREQRLNFSDKIFHLMEYFEQKFHFTGTEQEVTGTEQELLTGEMLELELY